MSLVDLLIFVLVIGGLVWLVLLLPFVEPFRKIIVGIGVFIIVVACLSTLFGINLLAHMRAIGSR